MLAALFGVSVGDLVQHNRLGHDHLIKAGDTLNIPARRSPLSSPSAPAGEVVYYTVRKGDNLWAIAQRHDIPVKHLRAFNGLGRGSVLMPGDTLRIVATERL
jgi:membrane-bound lytic murein transglycosylase D